MAVLILELSELMYLSSKDECPYYRGLGGKVGVFAGKLHAWHVWSSGILERAQALGHTVLVVSDCPNLEPYNEWIVELVGSDHVFLSDEQDDVPFASWRRLFAYINVPWPVNYGELMGLDPNRPSQLLLKLEKRRGCQPTCYCGCASRPKSAHEIWEERCTQPVTSLVSIIENVLPRHGVLLAEDLANP